MNTIDLVGQVVASVQADRVNAVGTAATTVIKDLVDAGVTNLFATIPREEVPVRQAELNDMIYRETMRCSV